MHKNSQYRGPIRREGRVPGRIKPKRITPRYTEIKLTKLKDKDAILKTTREK